MVIGVDLSKRKPQRVRGTPAAAWRNKLGLAVLSFSGLVALAFHFNSISENIRKSSTAILYFEPEGEVERKKFIAASINPRTADGIRRQREEDAKVNAPYS